MPETNAVARSLVLIDAPVFEQRYLVALLEDMPCHDVDVVLLGARAVTPASARSRAISARMSSSSFLDVRCL